MRKCDRPALASSGEPALQLAHMTYFRLVDRSPPTLRRFMSLCQEYLSGHDGQLYFWVGPRVTEMTRDVNVLSFDVAMNMVFDGLDSYETYRQHSRHLEFITQSVGMSSARSVYDSFVENDLSVPLVKVVAKKTQRILRTTLQFLYISAWILDS